MHTAMDQLAQDDNFLLFITPRTGIDISKLRPSVAHAFNLWQIYLDNVNPLLKVTHTPSLQARIVNALGAQSDIDPALEALMFGIDCVALLSLSDSECVTTFSATRSELLARYQIACREALLRCKFLHSRRRECLVALYLYLISVKPYVDRRSLCMMLGAAIRIAQRIGIDNEATNMKQSPFEAEMRRRLWWSLVLFDARVCESSDNLKLSSLIPTWTCKMPSNLSDFEMRQDGNALPESHGYPTEAFYVCMRCDVAQHLRHSKSHLDFINPSHRMVRKATPGEDCDNMDVLEASLRTRYWKELQLDNPLGFVTLWTTRSQLAKARLMKQYWASSAHGKNQMRANNDSAMASALDLIDSEAQLSKSQLVEGFRWHFTHMPFLGYAHVIQDLAKRPQQNAAERAWNTLSEDFKARFDGQPMEGHPVFAIFSKSVEAAWEARKTADAVRIGQNEPWIVGEMKRSSESNAAKNDEQFPLQPPGCEPTVFNGDLDHLLPSLAVDSCDYFFEPAISL